LKTIYAIPGLGTDERLFEKINVEGYELTVLKWPKPDKGLTLAEYAKRFLQQLNLDEPINLLGMSFGGMLCSELYDIIQTEKVVLISSCKTAKQMPKLLKALKYFPLHFILTNKIYCKGAVSFRRIRGAKSYYNDLLSEMEHAMPPKYFKRCLNYIVNWRKKESNKKIIQIHGTKDELMPIELSNADYIIENGTHTMILNRADEINLILNKIFNGE
jgi:pimeloyl-ACP methyl ester carboxylesterase